MEWFSKRKIPVRIAKIIMTSLDLKLQSATHASFFPERNQMVALKRLRLDCDDDGIPPTALREIALLKEMHHKHVVKYESSFSSRSPGRIDVFHLLLFMIQFTGCCLL